MKLTYTISSETKEQAACALRILANDVERGVDHALGQSCIQVDYGRCSIERRSNTPDYILRYQDGELRSLVTDIAHGFPTPQTEYMLTVSHFPESLDPLYDLKAALVARLQPYRHDSDRVMSELRARYPADAQQTGPAAGDAGEPDVPEVPLTVPGTVGPERDVCGPGQRSEQGDGVEHISMTEWLSKWLEGADDSGVSAGWMAGAVVDPSAGVPLPEPPGTEHELPAGWKVHGEPIQLEVRQVAHSVCVYCAEIFDTPPGGEVDGCKAHALACTQHPMRAVEAELQRVKAESWAARLTIANVEALLRGELLEPADGTLARDAQVVANRWLDEMTEGMRIPLQDARTLAKQYNDENMRLKAERDERNACEDPRGYLRQKISRLQHIIDNSMPQLQIYAAIQQTDNITREAIVTLKTMVIELQTRVRTQTDTISSLEIALKVANDKSYLRRDATYQSLRGVVVAQGKDITDLREAIVQLAIDASRRPT